MQSVVFRLLNYNVNKL